MQAKPDHNVRLAHLCRSISATAVSAVLVCVAARVTAQQSEEGPDAPLASEVDTPRPETDAPLAAGSSDAHALDAGTLGARITNLESEMAELTAKKEEDELARLVAEAESEAKAPDEGEKPEERTFLWGALALQKLNPEISISGDFVAGLIIDEDTRFYAGADDRSRFVLREAGLHLQHVLDPFSMFKSAINFIPEPEPEVELEEMYLTWFGIVPSLSLSVGRFRQNFGIINRWHEHDLDQVEYPLAMELVLGEGGLCQTGINIKWFMPPLVAHANELTIDVTNASNGTLLAGEFFSVPAVMAHLKNYYDLSDSTYLEVGLSGLWGFNNRRGYVDESDRIQDEPWRHTVVGGIDLTVHWSPLQQAKYHSFTWRSEGYLVRKQTSDNPTDVALGVAEPDGRRTAWGAYSYVEYQLATSWFAGVRCDLMLPTIRVENELTWDAAPYVTFWQSEFVYLRLEYRHVERLPFTTPDGFPASRRDDRVMLQIDWAAGPHKHEKY
jgi:hypothetical protein